MAGFASLVQNAGYAYVPLSPLLNNAFGMLFASGQQKRAEAAASKAQNKQLIGDITGAGIGAAATLGAGSMISSAMAPAANTAAATTAKATTGLNPVLETTPSIWQTPMSGGTSEGGNLITGAPSLKNAFGG